MKMKARLFIVAACCVYASAASSDSTLISRALSAAKNSKEGNEITEIFYGHCRERALSFSVPVPPIGRSENLNEIQIDRKTSVVTFLHHGTAYDGVDCKVTVAFNKTGEPRKVTTERLK